MNSAIEKGVRDFLAAQLGATSQTDGEGEDKIDVLAFTIGGRKVSLHTFVANDTTPEGWPCVVVSLRENKHEVGELYYGELSLGISTPMRTDGITEDTHRALVAAIKTLWVDDNAGDLDAAVQAAAGFACGSWFVQGFSDSLNEERWGTEMKVRLCLLAQ